MSFTVGGILSRIGSGNWTANLQCVNETDESAMNYRYRSRSFTCDIRNNVIQVSVIFRYYSAVLVYKDCDSHLGESLTQIKGAPRILALTRRNRYDLTSTYEKHDDTYTCLNLHPRTRLRYLPSGCLYTHLNIDTCDLARLRSAEQIRYWKSCSRMNEISTKSTK